MKRTLEFWLARLKETREEIRLLNSKWTSAYYQIKYYIKPYKLKSQYGHALNRDYTGYKIHKRRAKWIKRYLCNSTMEAKCKREIARLMETKIPFYKAKIAAEGYILKEKYDD